MADFCTTVLTLTISDWGKCLKKRGIGLDEMGKRIPLNWIVKSFNKYKCSIKDAKIKPRNEHSYDLMLELDEIDPELLNNAIIAACTVGVSFEQGPLKHNG